MWRQYGLANGCEMVVAAFVSFPAIFPATGESTGNIAARWESGGRRDEGKPLRRHDFSSNSQQRFAGNFPDVAGNCDPRKLP
jgi:hypothetical protein